MKKILSVGLIKSILIAGSVGDKFWYQDFLDFASNKGKFQANTPVQITSKDSSTTLYIDKMIDFGASNRSGQLMGEFANIGGSYVLTAAHMIGGSRKLIVSGSYLEFGGVRSRVIGSYNNLTDWWTNAPGSGAYNSDLRDFEVMRMDKINLNQKAEVLNADFFTQTSGARQGFEYKGNVEEILNNPRYSLFVRSGTGMQGLNTNGTNKKITDANKFFTGGFVANLEEFVSFTQDGEIRSNAKNANGSYKDFASSAGSGDSGSALYVYDNLTKQYYIIGVVSWVSNGCSTSSDSYACSTTYYALINNTLINNYKNDHTQVLTDSKFSINNNQFLDSVNTKITDTLDTITDATTRLNSLKDNKDYIFQNSSTITLNQNTDLGASGLYFANNTNSSIKGNFTFVHAGVVVGRGATLTYEAMTKAKDALVKMGEGKLIITSSSPNGKLRIGQGEVEIQSNSTSFGSIYAINGAKITLTKNNQVNADYIYFGQNGATLELNGASLTFNTINANDINANIQNLRDSTISTITLNANNLYPQQIYHGQFNGNINLVINNDYVFDGNLKIKNLTSSKNITFQSHPTTHSYVAQTNGYANIGDTSVYDSPTRASDRESRTFTFEDIQISNTSLNQGSDTILQAKTITATTSTINIGNSKIYLDKYDGENIASIQCGSFCDKYDEYYTEFKYQAQLSEVSIKNNNIIFKANISLKNNSTINFNTAIFTGSISDDNTSSANFNNTISRGSIKIKNFSANNSTFILDITNNNHNIIESTNSANGANNTISINPTESLNDTKIPLAKLTNTSALKKDFFAFETYNKGLSQLKPNITFDVQNSTYAWYLQKDDQGSYFKTSSNPQATREIDNALNQGYFNYVMEWNNLFKRMGELRDEESKIGAWARIYGGRSSYLTDFKTNFYEIQLGNDAHLTFNNFEIFIGGLISTAIYQLSNKTQSNGNITSIGTGIYGSILFHNGIYIDTIFKYLFYKNNFNLNIDNGSEIIKIDANNNQHAFLGSIELGYRSKFHKNFYLEPQIELISGFLGKQIFKDNTSNITLNANSYVPLHLKTALFSGYIFDRFSLRGGIGGAIDLVNNGTKAIQDAYTSTTYQGIKDSRMFLNLSTSYNFSTNTKLALEFERTFFGKLNIEYSFNLILRQAF